MIILYKQTWVYDPKPVKFTKEDKISILNELQNILTTQAEIKKKMNRIEIRAGRLYFYNWTEPHIKETDNIKFTKPLIEGKYLEYPFARITFYSKDMVNCDVAYQRHTGKWFVLNEGTFEDCLKYINGNVGLFY